jgi:hypothetical protein
MLTWGPNLGMHVVGKGKHTGAYSFLPLPQLDCSPLARPPPCVIPSHHYRRTLTSLSQQTCTGLYLSSSGATLGSPLSFVAMTEHGTSVLHRTCICILPVVSGFRVSLYHARYTPCFGVHIAWYPFFMLYAIECTLSGGSDPC